MKKLIGTIAVFSTVILLTVSLLAHAELANPEKGRFGAEISFWFPTVDGDVRIDFDDPLGLTKGTNVDIVDTLGIEESRMTLDVGVWVNITKRNRFSYYFLQDVRDGSKTLGKKIKVQGQDFAVNTKIDSKLEFQRHKFLYERALLRNDFGRIALGVGFEYLKWKTSVSGIEVLGLTLVDVGDSFEAPIPVISCAGEVHIFKGLGLFGEIAGFNMKSGGKSVSYVDLRGGPNFKTRYVFAQAGYQLVQTKVNVSDEGKLDYSLGGAFVSIGAKF